MYKSLKIGDTIGIVGVVNSVYRENRSGDSCNTLNYLKTCQKIFNK